MPSPAPAEDYLTTKFTHKLQIINDAIPAHERTEETLLALDTLSTDITNLILALKIAMKERDEARELANTDHLTGLHTRRVLEEEITRMGRRRERNPNYPPATVVLIDVDKFKSVNDKYTHAGGDAALKHVANLLKGELREDDFLARLGGDEFALIMYNAKPDDVKDLLRVLAKKIAGSPCDYEGKSIPVSITYGMHEMQGNETLADVIKATSEKVRIHKDAADTQKGVVGRLVGNILSRGSSDSAVKRVTDPPRKDPGEGKAIG